GCWNCPRRAGRCTPLDPPSPHRTIRIETFSSIPLERTRTARPRRATQRLPPRRVGPSLEAGRDPDRKGAQVRERKRVDRVDRSRGRLAAIAATGEPRLRRQRAEPNLRIEAAVSRDGEQVAAHEAHAPVPDAAHRADVVGHRSEEHTSELQSHLNLVCRLLLEKKKNPDRKGGVSRAEAA